MNIFKALLLLSICACAVAQEPMDEPAAPVVTTILTEELTVWPEGEAIVTTLDLPANFSFSEHYHPGEEILYVLEGDGNIVYRDQPNVHLSAGQAARIPAGMIHSGNSGEHGLKAVIFRVHPKGEPIRIEVADSP